MGFNCDHGVYCGDGCGECERESRNRDDSYKYGRRSMKGLCLATIRNLTMDFNNDPAGLDVLREVIRKLEALE